MPWVTIGRRTIWRPDSRRRSPSRSASPDTVLATPSIVAASAPSRSASPDTVLATPAISSISATDRTPRRSPTQRTQDREFSTLDARRNQPAPRTQRLRRALQDVPDYVPQEFRRPIARVALRNRLPASLLAAQLRQESGFNPDAVSPAGAQGIAQIMPGTAEALGLRDPFNPRQSIRAQGRYMRELADMFDGDLRLALAAYNAGPGAVQEHGGVPPYKETQDYVRSIMSATGEESAPRPSRPPRRAVRRWLQPTESREEIARELGVPVRRAGIAIRRLDPELQRALIRLGRATGEPVRINEGFRTRFRQEELAAGRGGATGPAAAPGTSQHEFGRAVDADLTPTQRQRLAEFGLGLPVPGEDWHVELVDGGSGVDPLPGRRGGAGTSTPPSFGGATAGGSAGGSGAGDLLEEMLLGRGGLRGGGGGGASASAPLPDALRRLRGDEEDEDEDDLLEAMLGDRFRPRRRLAR